MGIFLPVSSTVNSKSHYSWSWLLHWAHQRRSEAKPTYYCTPQVPIITILLVFKNPDRFSSEFLSVYSKGFILGTVAAKGNLWVQFFVWLIIKYFYLLNISNVITEDYVCFSMPLFQHVIMCVKSRWKHWAACGLLLTGLWLGAAVSFLSVSKHSHLYDWMSTRKSFMINGQN